jgi:hypothetical protein
VSLVPSGDYLSQLGRYAVRAFRPIRLPDAIRKSPSIALETAQFWTITEEKRGIVVEISAGTEA